MHPATLVTLNMRELERVKVIAAVVDGRLRCFQAAERLQLGVERSGPISGTTLSCALHVEIYRTYRAGRAFGAAARRTR